MSKIGEPFQRVAGSGDKNYETHVIQNQDGVVFRIQYHRHNTVFAVSGLCDEFTRRILLCTNALAGMDPSEFKATVEEIRNAAVGVVVNRVGNSYGLQVCINDLKAALAKLEQL